MKLGYARVSTVDQDLSLQIDALTGAGCERVFSDMVSGAKEDRPGLNQALDHLREGDILTVWRLDRLGRSLRHLVEIVSNLEERNIGFASLTECFDTTTNGGRLIFNIFGSLADFERGLIRERTMAGLAAGRARGRVGGRKEKLDQNQVRTLRSMYESKNHSLAEIARTFQISRPTVYRYLSKDI